MSFVGYAVRSFIYFFIHSYLLSVEKVMGDKVVPSYEDLANLPYLEMVLSEVHSLPSTPLRLITKAHRCQSMRLYPPQPGFVRRVLEDNNVWVDR